MTSTIFARLKADHDRHRRMLADIEGTTDADLRRDLFEAFRVEVTAHAASEELSLYATMLARPDLREEAQHSTAEHKEIEDYFTELYEADSASDEWAEKFQTMKHRYLHHIDEEEEEMFPAAEDGLSEERKAEIAKIFTAEKPREAEKAAADVPSSDDARD